MPRSILAISEGGPDAVPSFRLAAAVAELFDGTVDAVHFPIGSPEDVDIGAQAMPFLSGAGRQSLAKRARETDRAYREHVAPTGRSTLSADPKLTRAALTGMGRRADVVTVGRPGCDRENEEPISVATVLIDCARPVLVAPPDRRSDRFEQIVVAWNGSAQAARAVDYALPFLAQARQVTVLVADRDPLRTGFPFLKRHLGRHGIDAHLDQIAIGSVSGRARGRALLGYVHDRNADLLVMGAYGQGLVARYLGLGGATGKVISSSRVPLLLAA